MIRQALERAGNGGKTGKISDPARLRMVLVIDQMEEIFTMERVDKEDRERFVAVLSSLARSGFVWVIATMRNDFYPRCAEIPELVSLKEGSGQYDVLPPSFSEIGQMIHYPARAAGLRFEVNPQTGAKLDDALHEAAAGDPESLPLLEFTLDELFKGRGEDGILSFAAYAALGGLEGALAGRAEEVFSALAPEVQTHLPHIFRRLVTVKPGEERAFTSRPAPLEVLQDGPESRVLVDTFVKARLLVADRTADGQAVVRLAHEALLRRWPRSCSLSHDEYLLPSGNRIPQPRIELLHCIRRSRIAFGNIPHVLAAVRKIDRDPLLGLTPLVGFHYVRNHRKLVRGICLNVHIHHELDADIPARAFKRAVFHVCGYLNLVHAL
jgi:hypothetical protein